MPTQPGRNDPCWCGSGKKYKHCHLKQDQQAAAAPPPAEAVTPVASTGNELNRPAPYPPSLPAPSPADIALEAEWERFKQADLDGKTALFLDKLDSRSLEAEDSFEMLLAIRDASDVKYQAEARVRFAALIDRLRRESPEVYQHDQNFYLESLIKDAIADQHWAALPDLLNELAAQLPRSIEEFFNVVYAALYHGQAAPVRAALQAAWSSIADTPAILPTGLDEYGDLLMRLMLYDHLEQAPAPRDADPALMAALRAYGTPNTDWIERALRHLTAPAPTAWRVEDFGEVVDADQWAANVEGLWFEFMADQHRQAQVPFSRSDLARIEVMHVLHQQVVQPSSPVKHAKGKTRQASTPFAAQRAFLIPRFGTLNRELARHFSLLGSQPYHAGAPLELLPAYLHFIARLGLIHPTELDEALAELRPLTTQIGPVLTSYGADVHLAQAIETAWSEANLDALRRDPALEAARARPIVMTPPIESAAAPQTFTLKITYLRDPDAWFVIELRADQTLHQLHTAILDAVDFDSDHLYSFYLSGRAWDEDTEYALQKARYSSRTRLADLRLRSKQRWLYLFDYGDQHEFDVQLIATSSDTPHGTYPCLIEQHGQMPLQYPDWEDEGEEQADDDLDSDSVS